MNELDVNEVLKYFFEISKIPRMSGKEEKIQTYIVSILTVAVLIGIANIDIMKTIETSSTTKLLPIYNVETDEKKIAFTMNCAW